MQSYHTILQWLLLALLIFILAYITALMETVTIAHFPYYRFKVTTCLTPANNLPPMSVPILLPIADIC